MISYFNYDKNYSMFVIMCASNK